MNRSPLFYPLNRGMDADAGGAADLQTDVMRFMAIISMCLVAIFALVQSIPLAPVPQAVEPTVDELPPVEEEPVVAEPRPAPEPEHEIVLTRPVPASAQKVNENVALQRPVPKPIRRAVAGEVSVKPAPATPAKTQKGFSLRFESDRALTRLVARDIVGLYVISPEDTHRMSVDSGDFSFWAASTPERFHEMDVRTVPEPVLAAYRRRNASQDSTVKWGVSIPAAMSGELSRYMSGNEGGSLIIGLDGELRLEQ